MGEWMVICKGFTDENNQVSEGYYAEIASDKGVEARFLFGDGFTENKEDIIKQAYDHIRVYMPEYDASEMDIRFVENVYYAYDKIFVNEGLDTGIEREDSTHKAEGFFTRVYDSINAVEQGDFIDEFTLAVGYEIEDLSDEAFIKGAVEHLRPTYLKSTQIGEKEQVDKMAENIDYGVEVVDEKGSFQRRIDVTDDYKTAIQLGNAINHDGKTLADNEFVRVVCVDYANGVGKETMKTFERDEPDANKLFNDVLEAVHCSVEPYKDETRGIEGYRIYDKELGAYRNYDGEDVVATSAEMVMDELDNFLEDSFYNDLVGELMDCGLVKKGEKLPNTLFDLYVHTVLLANEEADGEGMKFWNAHEKELAMVELICNRIDEVDLEIAASLGEKELSVQMSNEEASFSEYAVETVDSAGNFKQQVNVYTTYDEAVQLAIAIKNNQDAEEKLEAGESVRVVRIDYDEGGSEQNIETEIVFFAEEPKKEATEMTQERAEELFKKVLDSVHFSVEYSELAKGYVVLNTETNEYLGEGNVLVVDEEAVYNDLVEICYSAADVLEKLDTYIHMSCDCFIDDMIDELGNYSLGLNPSCEGVTLDSVLETVEKWKELPETCLEARFYQNHAEEIAMMDLIVNHIDKVDLDKLYEVAPYCIWNVNEKMFVQMQGEKGNDYKLVNAEEATTFYSKSDVFNISQMLNDTSKDCFVVLYDKPERAADKLHIRDDTKKIAAENAEKKKRKSDYERD